MSEYIKNNRLTVLIVFSALLTGIIIGSCFCNSLENDVSSEIYAQINKNIVETSLFSAFKNSLNIQLTRFIVLFLCGLTVIGSPVSVFFIGYLGYTLGFSTAFLVKYYGICGILGILCGILPHYLLLLPSYLCIGIIGINFSNRLLLSEKSLQKDFRIYFIKMLLISMVIIISSVTEGFISTFFLKKILSLKIGR